MVKVTIYAWAGQKGIFRIKSPCVECDFTLHLLKEIQRNELAGAPLHLEVKPWLSYLGEALCVGGWHPPVVVIDGRRFSQGILPERSLLVQRLRQRLSVSGWPVVFSRIGLRDAF